MVKHLCPQRWLDQLPGDGEKPEVAGSAPTAILKCQALGALYVVAAMSFEEETPIGARPQEPAGRSALQKFDRNATEGAAMAEAIKAGNAALAAGATDEEAIVAAHEVAGAVLGLPPAQWRATDAALIAECHIVGTRTQRSGTEDERADLEAIVASRRQHTFPTPPHGNPQDT